MKTEEKRTQITGSMNPQYEEILTKEALEFIGRLERHFGEEDGNCCICERSGRLKLIKGRIPVFGGNEAHPRGGLDGRPLPGIWRTAGLKSPARSTEKWSSML